MFTRGAVIELKADYKDILNRIAEPPTWHDQNGTPRYGTFTPAACPDIYANQIGIFLIGCQACGKNFQVEMHASRYDGWRNERQPREWHYGDPPRHGCVGDTMNCDDLAVLEFWTRNTTHDFTRHSDCEVAIDQDAE